MEDDCADLDFLRYCCDVNGFSFVKNSRKYYDDASQILVELMIDAVRKEYHMTLSTRAPILRMTSTKDAQKSSTGEERESPQNFPSSDSAGDLSSLQFGDNVGSSRKSSSPVSFS
jgi:hypothetical protein